MKKIFVLMLILLAPFITFADSEESKSMHQSWDLNLDWMNDCEFNGTCDDSVDYTEAKTYDTKEAFLEAEGGICKTATDGCNSIGIWNGEFSISTEMWCEDVYGEGWEEVYSCESYDKEKIEYQKYIRDNISDLIEEKPVLGWTWYVTDIDWNSDNEIVVSYEDGHIVWEVTLTKSRITKAMENSSDDEMWEIKMCTLEYAPVCAEVEVQCIKAPCYPVQETFSNSCMAWENKILYTGQCNSYVNVPVYNDYLKLSDKLEKKVSKIPEYMLVSLIDRVNTMIDDFTLRNRDIPLIERTITKYVFIRELFKNELDNKRFG